MQKLILILPIILIFSLFIVDSIVFFEGNLDTVSISPLSEDSFLLAYCDEGNDVISFTTYSTTGEQLIGNFTIFQGTGCGNEGDSVSSGAFSESLFVIGTQSTDSSDVGFQIFNADGSNHTSRIVVDADVGAGNTNDIAVLNSSQFVFCFVDNGITDERVRCQVFDSDGNNISSLITVSNADANNVFDVAVDNINRSAYFVVHHETVGGQRALLLDTYLDNVVVADEITVDSDIGTHSEYDIIAFNDATAGIGFVASNQIDCVMVDFDGTILTPTTIIDASVSNNFENVQTAKINESSWILGWTDVDENATNAVVLNKSCGIIVSQTQIFDDTEQIIGVASEDNGIGFCFDNVILAGIDVDDISRWTSNHSDFSSWDGICVLNQTNLDVFLSKNPVEILEQFVLFANYTNATDNQPILNAICFANSSVVGGGDAGFGRGVLGIGGLSTLGNAVHTQVNRIMGNETLRVDIKNIPLGKASYGVNFRFHAHNQTPNDNLRVFATCHNNLTFSNFTLIGQVNTTEAVISTSNENDTIWGFKNVVLFGQSVATENCSIVFESINTSENKHWMIADTVSTLNLNNSFTSIDFGETYVLRTNADTRSPFVDAGFGLDVPNETTMTFNSTSGLYFLDNIRHGRPFDFIDRVFCSADNFENATDFVITNVEDNVPPIVQISSITPRIAVINVDNVTIQWSVNDPELVFNIINVSFPNGSLLVQTDEKPLILTPDNLTVTGNYTVIAFANDTGGLSTTANDSFEVAVVDVTPPVITLITPANNTAQSTIPLNITFTVSDNFPNDIICILENSTFVFDTGTFTQGANSNLTLAEGFIALSQEFPNLELTCFDNSDPFNNSATLNLNYTLDTIPPVIQTFNPLDNSRINKQIFSAIEISGNCSDVPVFNFNITVSNTSDTIATFQDNTPVNNVLSITENISITNLGVGFYTVNYTCADTHTKQRIGDYNVRKNDSNFEIKWVATDGNQFRIRYLQNSIAFNDFGSTKVADGDRYDFFFNSNETESKTERTFIFEILSRKEVHYLPDSSYKAHFITGNNWIDFEFDDADATYVVTKNSRGNWEVEVTTTRTKLNFKSIGELNIATVSTTFEIFSIEQITDFFNVTVCRTDTGSVLLLSLFFLISLILITMAMASKIGFIGIFGALMLLFTSLRVVACIRIVAIILIFLSILFFFFFIFRGFWPSVYDQKRAN